ncbi:Hypothetical protein POVN_LOCUS437 [uncultured virus]|nr:Hypothetical protein POVN_LOCUS437 [uncultured virus]
MELIVVYSQTKFCTQSTIMTQAVGDAKSRLETKTPKMDLATFQQLAGAPIRLTNAEYADRFIKLAGRCGGQAIGHTLRKLLRNDDLSSCLLELWFRTVETANEFLAELPQCGADFIFCSGAEMIGLSESKSKYDPFKGGCMVLDSVEERPNFSLSILVADYPKDVYFDIQAIGYDGTHLIANGTADDAFAHLREGKAYVLPSLLEAAAKARDAVVKDDPERLSLRKATTETEAEFRECRETVYESFLSYELSIMCGEKDFVPVCTLPDCGETITRLITEHTN